MTMSLFTLPAAINRDIYCFIVLLPLKVVTIETSKQAAVRMRSVIDHE